MQTLRPTSDILAKLDCVQFYKERSKLAAGTYQIIEHDGEINYAVVYGHGTIDWYSKAAYERALNNVNVRPDAQLGFDADDRKELMDSWDTAMARQEDQRLCDEICLAGDDVEMTATKTFGDAFHRDHDEFRRVDPHDFANDDDRVEDEHLIVEMSKPGKTIGDLLREAMATAEPITDVPKAIAEVQDLVSDSYRDYTLLDQDKAE